MEASLFLQWPLCPRHCVRGGTHGSALQGRDRGPVGAVQPLGHSDSQLTLFIAHGDREPLGRVRGAPTPHQAVMCGRLACLLGLCWQKGPLMELKYLFLAPDRKWNSANWLLHFLKSLVGWENAEIQKNTTPPPALMLEVFTKSSQPKPMVQGEALSSQRVAMSREAGPTGRARLCPQAVGLCGSPAGPASKWKADP